MKILNFGSLNIDYVYQVDHINVAGETQQSLKLDIFPGGKGLNQSIALARAGAHVYHAGFVGEDGQMLLDICRNNGIDDTFIRSIDGPCGHAIIQVDKNAQNSILVYGGSNQRITREYIDEVLEHFHEGDLILLQNEINLIDYIIDKAYDKKMVIVLNPSPYNDALDSCDLSKVSIFLMNEIEGREISKGLDDPFQILDYMMATYPNSKVVLTLGKDGAYFRDKKETCYQKAIPVETVDTTAAGDTFTGYFIYGLVNQLAMQDSLRLAATASSITVSRMGAASSIPTMQEIIK